MGSQHPLLRLTGHPGALAIPVQTGGVICGDPEAGRRDADGNARHYRRGDSSPANRTYPTSSTNA